MAIEVKQLVIKSTLVSGERGREHERTRLAREDLDALKRDLLEQCRELLEQNLEKNQER